MQRLAVAVIFMLSAIFFDTRPVDAQAACDFYRVQKGDTLKDISERVYGDRNHRRIWRANREEIGRDPSVISIGLVLRLPCADGALPKAALGASRTAPGKAEISFVTANGYLPYTDESLSHRGLFTHLVTNAMVRAAPETRFEVVFVNDWAAHVETLLPRQSFDASFPWSRPGCETQGMLTEVELYACQNFVYTDPFYEIVEGFFAWTGSGFEGLQRFDDMVGTRICRPEGYPTGHLEEQGLMTSDVTLLQPTSATACFQLLLSGKADLVALDTRAGERVVSDLGLEQQVSENPHLFSIQPLRVALHKDNPKTVQLVEQLNTGLGIMRESGEWAAIVSDSLKEQTAALVN